ncbi:MAG TPA: sialidase family protein [Bryobacteraceae bacterium]
MFISLLAMVLVTQLAPVASDAPSHEPQIATSGSLIGLAFGAGKGIYFSASHDSGETFSAPVKVAEAAIVPLTRHRGPRIAFSGRTIVISAVAGKKLAGGPHAHGLPSDGDLMVWRSVDSGKTWSKGIVVNDVPGAPTEGLHSLAADDKGRLFAAWLDKRGEKGTRLYGARSSDAGATWSKNVLIYQSPEGTICECCHPSVAFDANGQILVMWRNWIAGARDMYLTQSRDGEIFAKPEKLGTGSWQLNACPMDGGGLATSGGRIITLWRRGEGVFLAEPEKPEKQIGSGKDLALAVSQGRVYAVWSSASGIILWSSGKAEVLAGAGAFPAVAALPDGGVLTAWEADGSISLHRTRP